MRIFNGFGGRVVAFGAAAVLGLAAVPSANAAEILIVSDQPATGGRDDTLISTLQSLGHTVDTSGMGQAYREGNGGAAAALARAVEQGTDLILVSRSTTSGSYDNDSAVWNSIPVPMLVMAPHLSRSSHWGLLDSTAIVSDKNVPSEFNAYPVPDHPFVAGLGTSIFPEGARMDYLNSTAVPAGATIVGTLTEGANTFAVLVDIPAGAAAFGTDRGIFGADRALLQLTDYPDVTGVNFGLSDNGVQILGQVITTVIPEPGTIGLLAVGAVLAARRRR